jgi:hypothetical protein
MNTTSGDADLPISSPRPAVRLGMARRQVAAGTAEVFEAAAEAFRLMSVPMRLKIASSL